MKPIRSSSHIELTYITHFYCDAEEKLESVYSLLRNFATYSDEVLDKVHFVIVDDCSPLEYETRDFGLNITWLKVTDDIKWNNPGARNLGVVYAKSENIVMTDTDHSLPEDTMAYLCSRKPCGKSFYKFRRRRDDGSIGRGHSNLFFMARSRFLMFYGYDEEFCGDYAHDDMWFVKFQKWHGSLQRYLPSKYLAEKRAVDSKKHNHSLVRDLATNEDLYQRKRKESAEYGEYQGHTRTFLDFKWDVAMNNTRSEPEKKESKVWRQLWWFRVLNPFC